MERVCCWNSTLLQYVAHWHLRLTKDDSVRVLGIVLVAARRHRVGCTVAMALLQAMAMMKLPKPLMAEHGHCDHTGAGDAQAKIRKF